MELGIPIKSHFSHEWIQWIYTQWLLYALIMEPCFDIALYSMTPNFISTIKQRKKKNEKNGKEKKIHTEKSKPSKNKINK